jgi:phage baseplate assembly protein V
MSAWGLSEVERRLANMVKIGVISAVDHDAKKIRVEAGGMNSAWLPWPVEMGRNFRRWRPLREGQQVIMVAPSGELAQAAVIGMLYSSSLDAPDSNPDLDLTLFDDSTRVQYDSAAHQLDVDLGSSSLAMNRDSITMTSNGSTIEMDAAGIRLNGARIDLN